jgi:hypothetical protein
MVFSPNPLIWIAAIVLLVLFWPRAQRLRRRELAPLAAYLLFSSVFALVGAAVFMPAVRIGIAVLPEGAMRTTAAPPIVLLVATVPAFLAARLVVRRPQIRRMPR